MKFQKGQPRPEGAGIKKGQKHDKTILFAGVTEDNKREIFDAAMKLVRKGNFAVINKLLDKILPSLQNVQTNMGLTDAQIEALRNKANELMSENL